MSDSDIVKDFLQESYENLDRLDRELVGLDISNTIASAVEEQNATTTRWLGT